MDIREEIVRLSDPRVPIKTYVVDNTTKRLHATHHLHKELEIIYMMEGCMRFTIEGEVVDLLPGMLLFINGMTMHFSEPLAGEYKKMCLLQFVPDMILKNTLSDIKYLSYFIHKNSFRYYVFSKDKDSFSNLIIDTVLQIAEEFESKKFAYELFIKSKLTLIMGILYRARILVHDVEVYDDNSKYMDKVTYILKYIENNYHRNIGIREISDMLDINYYACIRSFKNITGTNFVHYLNFYRVMVAKEMLVDWHKSITDIVKETGFQSLSYFNRTFRKYNGCSPSQYRLKLKKGVASNS